MLRKSVVVLIIMVTVVSLALLGCSQSEPLGYTYDMTKKCSGLRLAEISDFEYEIVADRLTGYMRIGSEQVSFEAEKKDKTSDYEMYKGLLHYKDANYNFEMNFSNLVEATGLYYNSDRTLVHGFIIERLSD